MSETTETFAWTHRDVRLDIGIRRLGTGPTLLMLPALSSISTLEELAPLQARLAARFATVALDWPGFGTRARPAVDWTRAHLQAYLDHVLTQIVPRPFATVAAGHGAGYLMDAEARHPGLAGRSVLVAPTWRGPLPTMMKRRSALSGRLVRAGDLPGVGSLLYRMNVNPPMVRLMARRHVYSDPAWLDPERLAAKMRVIDAPGARHAALRFVTGLLDPFDERDGWSAAADLAFGRHGPALMIYGAESPEKSRAEMEVLATHPGIETIVLPKGRLAPHEEIPDAVANAILPFLTV